MKTIEHFVGGKSFSGDSKRKGKVFNPATGEETSKVKLGNFTGSNYKLKKNVWDNFNWEIEKCVLRSDNNPIKNNI